MKKTYLFFTVEGFFSLFYIWLVQGPIFTGLSLNFRLDEFLLSVATAIPTIMQVFQMFASFFVLKFKKRKLLVNVFNALSRYIYCLLLFFLLFDKRDPIVFLAILSISQVFAALAGSTWISWMRDLIPEEERGKAFGTRNIFLSLGNAIIIYLYSFLVDNFSIGFELVLIVSAVASLFSILSMNLMPDVPVKTTGSGVPLRVVFKDGNFMRYVLFNFYWSMSVMFSSAFYHYHLIKDIGVSYTYIAYMTILNSVVAMFTYRLWGKLSDKVGHKTVAETAIFVVSSLSIAWFFMNTVTYKYLMLVDSFVSALGWSALNLTLTVLPMEIAFDSDPIFFGLNAAFGSLGGILGSVLGGGVAKVLSGVYINFYGFEVFGLQFLFVLAGLFRMSSIIWLRKVKTKKYVPVKDFVLNTFLVPLRKSLTKHLLFINHKLK